MARLVEGLEWVNSVNHEENRPKSGKTSKNDGKGGTPAIVVLEQANAIFSAHSFTNEVAPGEHGYGKAAAHALGVEEDRVFKTLLVTLQGGSTSHAVGIVPVSGKLSLKGIAAALHAKKADMLDPVAAERMTGYVVGGISPFGQRKLLPTVIDETATLWDTIFVSGGKRGLDIEIGPHDLVRILSATVADISG
jgi:Cys-tRNA(Pro)/Cys-tRNA(Cys) deacylase